MQTAPSFSRRQGDTFDAGVNRLRLPLSCQRTKSTSAHTLVVDSRGCLKTIILAAVVLASSGTVPAWGAHPKAVIAGPTGGVPGDILWLDASASVGEHFLWKVLPAPEEGRLGLVVYPGDPRKCQIPSRPGTYKIFLAVSNPDGVDLTTWSVTVNDVTPPFPPDPAPPQPFPPGPTPPGPSPYPTPVPPGPDPLPPGQFDLSRDVANWGRQVSSPTRGADARALAEAAESIAAAIASGTLSGAQKILSAVFTANNTALGTNVAAWHEFGDQLSARIKSLYLDRRLTTDSAWATVLREVAIGLRSVR